MMNHCRQFIFLIILWLMSADYAAATHLMGADLVYKNVGKDSFYVTLKIYRDCNGITLSNSPIFISSPGCSTISKTLSLISVKDITNLCGGTDSKCVGGTFPYGVEEHTFEGLIKTSSFSSCCLITIDWSQSARNSNITTGQADNSFFTYATLDRCNAPTNSSPSIFNKPIAFGCWGKNLVFNNGVMDTIDGDSLSYELADALQYAGTPCTYNSGYDKLRPMYFLGYPNRNLPFPAGFHLDSTTGDLGFRPTIQQIGIVVIQINEWRKVSGIPVKIGETRRDMQIIITSSSNSCSNNSPALPTITTKQVCVGQTLTFNIKATDSNTGDSVNLTWNKGIKGATFTADNGAAMLPTGTFTWTPTIKDTSSNLYHFAVIASDNGCPWNGVTSRGYSVRVNSTPVIKIFSPHTCYPDSNIFTDSSTVSFGSTASRKWKLGDGDTADSKTVPHLYANYGSYDVKLNVTSNAGCKDSSTRTVKYSPKPVAAFNISINCRELQDTFHNASTINPDSIVSNLWDFGDSTSSIVLSPIKTYAKPGIYPVSLITVSNNGCSDTATKYAGEQLHLQSMRDTIICRGQSVSYTAAGQGGNTAGYAFSWDQGAGNSPDVQLSPDTTTTYMVVLNDSCNNNPDTGYVTVTVKPALDVVAAIDTTICIGQSFKLTAQTSGGIAGSHILTWQGLGTGSNFLVSPTTTTTYRAVLTDNCSEPDTDYVTVTVRPALSAGPRSDTTICKGQQLLLLAAPGGGDSSQYVLNWDQGLGQGNHFSISPSITTTYRVILSDNCTSRPDTAEITISVRPPLIIRERQDTFFCNGQGAELYASASGGDSLSYNFSWDQGVGNGNYLLQHPAISTTYRVIASDNCTAENDTGYVTLNVRVPLNLQVPADTLICKGQQVSLYVAGTGGDSLYYSYEWDKGLGSGNNKIVAPENPVTFRVILKDNCTLKADTDYVNITVKPPLQVIPRSDTTICIGQSLKLFASSAGGDFTGHTFIWDSAPAGGSFIVSPAISSVYRVILSDNCTAKPDTGYVNVTVRQPLKIIPMADTTICMGQSLTLHALAGGGNDQSYFYGWDQAAGNGNFVNATPVVNTTYRVILSDNCTSLPDTGFVNVSIRDLLKIITRQDTLICIGQNVKLSALTYGGFSPDHTLTWDHGLGKGNTFKVTPAVTTIYKVLLTDQCTSMPDSGYVKVSVRPELQAFAGDDTTICAGNSTDLFAYASGGNSATGYFAWEKSEGGPWTHIAGGGKLTVSPAITTDYRLIVRDNCTTLPDTDYVTVNVRGSLKADAGPDQLICYGQSADIAALGSGGFAAGYTYSWNNGIGNGMTKTVSPNFTTTYRVILTDNCTSKPDTDFVTINVRPQLKVHARPYVKICFGQSVQLFSQGMGGIVADHQFSWDNGLGSGNSFTVSPATTTVYTVTLNDGCSLAATDTVTVEVEQLPVAAFEAIQTVCFPDTVRFKNTSQHLPQSAFRWHFGDNKTSTLFEPRHVYPSEGTYSVSLKVTSAFGCTDSVHMPGFITVNPKPKADFTASPDSTTILTPAITFTNLSTGAIQNIWDFADHAGNSFDLHPVYIFKDTGSYQVSLLVTNQFGCTDKKTRRIRIEDVFRFFIPNTFTPNGDNINDVFLPVGMGYRNYKTQIFNRWGQVIFESTDKNINWNGGFFNQQLIVQDGVYTYQISVIDYDGRPHYFSGMVHVIR
jgi:gliding motility-associated-like protein